MLVVRLGKTSIMQMTELISLIFKEVSQIHTEKSKHPMENNGQRFEEMIHGWANSESSCK